MSIEPANILSGLYPEQFSVRPLSGGDINEAYHCTSPSRDLVIKINRKSRFPAMFEKEAAGLDLLRSTDTLLVPAVHNVGDMNEDQFIVMDYVAGGLKSNKMWENFGRGLSKLHQNTAELFGLDHSNYIGSLPQPNLRMKSWQDFLVTQRFEPMLRMAVDHRVISDGEQTKFEKFIQHIPEIWPEEKPALLHGDLWSGNFIAAANDQAALIDPAVYYGHREMDIGMMHLFGGFDQRLFDSYNEQTPLAQGWKERIPFNQLYPLLVHVNLFGRSYWNSVNQIISGF